MIEHIQQSYEGKLKAWAALGANLPTRLVGPQPLTGDLDLDGHRFELEGGPAAICPTATTCGSAERPRDPRRRAGLSATSTSGSPTPPTAEQRAAWIALLDEMAALDPELVVPGHRLPGAAADATAIALHPRRTCTAFEAIVAAAADGAAADRGARRALPGAPAC